MCAFVLLVENAAPINVGKLLVIPTVKETLSKMYTIGDTPLPVADTILDLCVLMQRNLNILWMYVKVAATVMKKL